MRVFRSELCVLATALSVLLLFAGCEQVSSVVDEAHSSVVEDSTDETTENVVVSEPAEAPAVVAPTPVVPKVSAAELIAEFEALRPEQIDDSALERVTQTPESAASVTAIESTNAAAITGAGLNSMAKMPNLEKLTMVGAAISASELTSLGSFASLRELNLKGTQADDNVIAAISGVNLEDLDLSGTRVTSGIGASLAGIRSLKSLDLQSTQIDDSTIAALDGLPIRHLNLSRCRITSESMKIVGKMTNLESLDVSFTQVPGAAFKGINQREIRVLNVGETNFGIEGFKAIKGMKHLEELNVYRCGLVENTKCNVFKTMPKLRILNAGGNTLTDAGMKVFFKGHRSLEQLSLLNCKSISDRGLAELVAVKTLTNLNVANTGCTPNGAMALKQRIPECTIVTNGGTF